MTDGWRNGPGRMWRSAENPTGSLDFVYTFRNPVTIRTVQLHQNSSGRRRSGSRHRWTRQTYAPLAELELPEKGKFHANFAYALKTDLDARAR